jgi:hypothetical protein
MRPQPNHLTVNMFGNQRFDSRGKKRFAHRQKRFLSFFKTQDGFLSMPLSS